MPNHLGPFEVHEMPNGNVVYFRSSDHSYWRDATNHPKDGWKGKGRLTGVSTVVKPFNFSPDALLNWAARLNGEGIAILAADGLSQDTVEDMRASLDWLTSGQSIWDALSSARLLYSDMREDAARRGTNVHQLALAALADGQPVPLFADMTPQERGYARGVARFWSDHQPEPLHSEQVVFHDVLNVAGRLDLRCRVGAETWLLDCKTSGYIPASHHCQLSGYELLAVESGFGASDRQLILQVDADGGYRLIDNEAELEDFANALLVYRAAGRINTGQRRQMKAAA